MPKSYPCSSNMTKKRVHFSSAPKLQEVLLFDRVESACKRQVWYCATELKKLQYADFKRYMAAVKDDLDATERDIFSEMDESDSDGLDSSPTSAADGEFTSRGLEDMNDEFTTTARKNYVKTIVLYHQEQRSSCSSYAASAEELRKVARDLSKTQRKKAKDLGKADAKAVLDYYGIDIIQWNTGGSGRSSRRNSLTSSCSNSSNGNPLSLLVGMTKLSMGSNARMPPKKRSFGLWRDKKPKTTRAASA